MKRLAIVWLSLASLILVGSQEKASKQVKLSQSAAAPNEAIKREQDKGSWWSRLWSPKTVPPKQATGASGPSHEHQEKVAKAAEAEKKRKEAEKKRKEAEKKRKEAEKKRKEAEKEKQEKRANAWAGGDAYFETGSAAARSGSAKPSTKPKETIASEWVGGY